MRGEEGDINGVRETINERTDMNDMRDEVSHLRGEDLKGGINGEYVGNRVDTDMRDEASNLGGEVSRLGEEIRFKYIPFVMRS